MWLAALSVVGVRGIGPRASRTPYERSTDDLHPELSEKANKQVNRLKKV